MLESINDNLSSVTKGLKVRVELPTKWIGSVSSEPTTLCPGVIREMNKSEDGTITSLYIDIRYSPKYKNSPISNMVVFKSDFNTVFIDKKKRNAKDI